MATTWQRLDNSKPAVPPGAVGAMVALISGVASGTGRWKDNHTKVGILSNGRRPPEPALPEADHVGRQIPSLAAQVQLISQGQDCAEHLFVFGRQHRPVARVGAGSWIPRTSPGRRRRSSARRIARGSGSAITPCPAPN